MRLSLIVILVFSVCSVNAQKLPNKQEISLHTPANIKIDGKATEWDNKFQAYNNATDLFYTIANDDNKLYLAFQGNLGLINKITANGVSFLIQDVQKKQKSVSITYPLINWKQQKTGFNFVNVRGSSQQELETAMAFNNNILKQSAKFIKVTGIENIDTLSIYNDNNISAAGLFDLKMNYTCEMAIPLKYLNSLKDESGKIAYHVKINGLEIRTANSAVSLNASPEFLIALNRATSTMQASNSPTDFWGEYILAK